MEGATALAPDTGSPRRPGRFLRGASDDRLVAGMRQGREAAFEAIYERYHRGILSFCRHMLGNPHEAEDAVQQTFVSAYRSLKESDRPVALRPWLYTIARNRCLSMLRARRPVVALEDAQPATDGLADEVQRRQDLRELLVDLAHLPEQQRAALLLAELGAHSHREIATVLDVRPEKVKALVFQARETLAGQREARAIPCEAIREELSVAAGAALRRSPLRRHLAGCPGCRAYGEEVRRQRVALAVVLPVLPSLALRSKVLAAAAGASHAGAAAGGTAAAGTSAAGLEAGSAASSAAPVAVLAGKGLAAKVLIGALLLGGAGGGAYLGFHSGSHGPGSSTHGRALAARHGSAGGATVLTPAGAGQAGGTAAPPTASASGPVVVEHARPLGAGSGRHPGRHSGRHAGLGPAGRSHHPASGRAHHIHRHGPGAGRFTHRRSGRPGHRGGRLGHRGLRHRGRGPGSRHHASRHHARRNGAGRAHVRGHARGKLHAPGTGRGAHAHRGAGGSSEGGGGARGPGGGGPPGQTKGGGGGGSARNGSNGGGSAPGGGGSPGQGGSGPPGQTKGAKAGN